MEDLHTVEYYDFLDTKEVYFNAGSLELPKLTMSNFIQLIDEHNKMVYAFKEYVDSVNEEIKTIKQSIR